MTNEAQVRTAADEVAWLVHAEIGDDPPMVTSAAPGEGYAPSAFGAAAAGAVLDHDGVLLDLGRHWASAGFRSADEALAAGLGIHRALSDGAERGGRGHRARVGVHRGASHSDQRALRLAIEQAAQVAGTADSGQTALTAEVREALSAPATVMEVGSFWLDAFDGPVDVLQARGPEEGPTPLLAPRPGPLGSARFDRDLSSFRGRSAELAELVGLLEPARIVTLVGPGGAGKSRLAREAVRRLCEEGADARLVELSTVRDPAAVPGVVAAAVGLRLGDDRPQRDVLVEHLHGAAMVLVIDNCEHLIAAAGQLAAALAAGCSRLRILATSRSPLGAPGERQLRLASLAIDDAVALFVDRAVGHGWESAGPDDDRALAELCHRLDRLPLAIEIAAGWTATMTVPELLAAYGDRAGLLDRPDPSPSADDRHRSLGAVLDWSYELLAPDEQEALDRLSVLAGRFDLAAAAAVLDDPQRSASGSSVLVRALVERSLVLVEREGNRNVFLLHEAVRAHAGRRLEARGEREVALTRLGSFLCGQLDGRPDDRLWLDEVQSRQGTLHAAIDDLSDVDPPVAARLARVVARYARSRSNVGSGIERLLGWASRLAPTDDTRDLVGDVVFDLTQMGRIPEARQWAERHEALTAALGRPSADHPPALLQGHLALMSGHATLARDILVALVEGAESGGDPLAARAELFAHWNLSCAEWALGRPKAADVSCRRALELAAELGEVANARHLAGNLLFYDGSGPVSATQAANCLRWMDEPDLDPDTAACPTLVTPAAWIAAEIGRYGDAARLVRLLLASPPLALIYNDDEERPEDLGRRLAAVDPAAWAAAMEADPPTPAEAIALAREVLVDPGLPPQAELIDPFTPTTARVPGVGCPPDARPPDGPPLDLLRHLGPIERASILAGADRRRYQRGEAVFHQGEAGAMVHLVVSGWVAHRTVTPDGEVATLDVVGPGALVGELSLLHPGIPRPSGAVALAPVETIALRHDELDDLCRRHPAVQQALIDQLLGQVRRLSGSLTDALALPADKRVLRRLLDLCAVYAAAASEPGRRTGSRAEVTIPLTQDELATMAGTSRPTVNRVLRQAETEGYLRLGRGRIEVDDGLALCRAAEVDPRSGLLWPRRA